MVVLIGPQGEVPVQRLHVRLQRLPEQDRDVRIRHQKTDPSGLSERVRQHRPGDHFLGGRPAKRVRRALSDDGASV